MIPIKVHDKNGVGLLHFFIREKMHEKAIKIRMTDIGFNNGI